MKEAFPAPALPSRSAHPPPPAAAPGVSALQAEMLLNRLMLQVEQLRHAHETRPWHAAHFKAIARMLECACRTAFADRDLWSRLSQPAQDDAPRVFARPRADERRPGVPPRLRPGGFDRAEQLLDQAADRLARLTLA